MKENTFFIEIKELIELEQEKKWLDTLILLENKAKDNNDNVEYLNRYLAQCCFILSEWDFYLIGSSSDYLSIKRKLIELVKENNNNFDYKYKFIYGYFASLFPFIFTFNPEEEKQIEETAKCILKEIYGSNESCLIYEYFYLGTNNLNKKKRNTLAAQLVKEKNIIFPLKSHVEEYFNSIIVAVK